MEIRRAVLAIFLLSQPWPSRAQALRGLPVPSPQARAGARQPVSYSAVIQFEEPLELQRDGSPKTEPVTQVPLRLSAGDRLRTGERGAARLLLKDFSELRLGPNTSFELAEETPSSVVLDLLSGRIWVQARKDRGRKLQVSDPVAVSSVRGTEFSVSFDGRGSVTEVRSGVVAVQALAAGRPVGPEVLVSAGQRVKVSDGQVGPVETIEGRLPHDPEMPLPAQAYQATPQDWAGFGAPANILAPAAAAPVENVIQTAGQATSGSVQATGQETPGAAQQPSNPVPSAIQSANPVKPPSLPH